MAISSDYDEESASNRSATRPARQLTVAEEEEISKLNERIERIRQGPQYTRRPRIYGDALTDAQDQQLRAADQALLDLGDYMPRIIDDYQQNTRNIYSRYPLGLGKPVAAVVNTIEMITQVGPQLRQANRDVMATTTQLFQSVTGERAAQLDRAIELGVVAHEHTKALEVAKTQAESSRLTRQVDYDFDQAALAADHERAKDLADQANTHETKMKAAETNQLVAKVFAFDRVTGGRTVAADTIRDEVAAISAVMEEFELSPEQREGFAKLANAAVSRQVDATIRNKDKLGDIVMEPAPESHRQSPPRRQPKPAERPLSDRPKRQTSPSVEDDE